VQWNWSVDSFGRFLGYVCTCLRAYLHEYARGCQLVVVNVIHAMTILIFIPIPLLLFLLYFVLTSFSFCSSILILILSNSFTCTCVPYYLHIYACVSCKCVHEYILPPIPPLMFRTFNVYICTYMRRLNGSTYKSHAAWKQKLRRFDMTGASKLHHINSSRQLETSFAYINFSRLGLICISLFLSPYHTLNLAFTYDQIPHLISLLIS
jgi:hypothetical protein